MTTKYRVEYALKTHRRDQFIEWIKGLLAVPFVLHSQPTAIYDGQCDLEQMARTAKERYGQIMEDVERLVLEHITHHRENKASVSKLKLLVPSIGNFFTPLRLKDAFFHQDSIRRISSRRFVPPSFNDVRAMLNTAQIMSLIKDTGRIELMTFDGDVTLYDDGESLKPENPAIPRLLKLLRRGIKVGLVTAAGYTEASKYYDRLHGLLDAVHEADDLGDNKRDLIVMGGEANYLFKYSDNVPERLEWVPREQWALQEMNDWTEDNIKELLDTAERALRDCVKTLNLHGQVLRKDRAVGVYPATPGYKFPRELLEETVLVVQKMLEMSEAGQRIPFCAFNGGNDVFVDIGDKSWGVLITQKYFGGIEGGRTIHVGDQFLSAGANDFKARLACTTAWIASPSETVALLDEIETFTTDVEKSSHGHKNGNGNDIELSKLESKPDVAPTTTAAARELLDTPGIPNNNENTPPNDGTTSYNPSTYDADASSTADETISSSGTSVPPAFSVNRSTGGSSAFGGAKSSVPDTLADRTEWMNISRGKLGKYANKYARKEPEAADVSVHGDSQSVTAGAGADAEGGEWGAEAADTPSQVESAEETPAVQTW